MFFTSTVNYYLHYVKEKEIETKTAQLCSAQTLAHKPALRRRDPQKYTYSYHGNKCLKGNSRSVTKSDSRGPGKSQRAIKDT